MPRLLQRPYLHLLPIEPSECLPSWLLRIAARYTPSFQRFSTVWLLDELRVTPGFDAFPAASLLMQLGANRGAHGNGTVRAEPSPWYCYTV